MKAYAERAWGTWDGRADFDPEFDQVIQCLGADIGLIGIQRRTDHWFLDKLYVMPDYQNRGIGSLLVRRVIADAKAARTVLRLTVLEGNPARRFYERHGFILTHTLPPRHHMKWRPSS